MEELYKTPNRNGRISDADDVTVFQTPSKGLVDRHRHRWLEPTSPSKGLPNSHRDNVVDALKNIQDRIRALEVERTTAEENLKGLSKETNYYRRSLEQLRAESSPQTIHTSPRSRTTSTDHVSPSVTTSRSPRRLSSTHQHDMQEQLRSADSRCELLDKQLEYMRKMLNEAEAEKRLAYERSEQMMRLRNANTGQEMRSQMEKISEMEREHHRLQASQVLAQERIKDLERALENNRNDQRVAPANLTSELRSAAKTNQILIDKLSPPVSPSRKPTVKSVKRKKRMRKAAPVQPRAGQHYRLNLADIPFVVGQSTAPSHRVGSNVQNVIAKLKTHNPDICGAVCERPRPRSAPPRRSRNKGKLMVTCSENSESEGELQDMMDQLAEEYTHMSAEHQELTREMDSANSASRAAGIHDEIERLEMRMSTKAEQIAKLSAYQSKLREKRGSEVTTSRSLQAKNAYKVPSSSTTGDDYY
ncbi:centrosomal protein of 57 kDa-like isoform X2 [Watersipora subatra]|uniref:centrosomal protein of 57 kDa-like isoform X2 n=1 Tax=Watersipora subatra TaxID=2589382 RepID=UPI00355AF7B9